MKLDAIISQYIAAMRLKDQAPKTLKEKRNSLMRFCCFVGNNPLTPQVALEYIIHLQTKPIRPYVNASLAFEITMLKTFEKWQLKHYPDLKEWTILLERPKKQPSLKNFVYVDPLKIDEAIEAGSMPVPFVRRGEPGDNAINAKRKLEARAALKMVSRKGLRIEEVLRLTGKDLNFDAPIPEFRIAPIKGHVAVWTQIPADMTEELRSRKGKLRVFETTEKLCNLVIQRGWDSLQLPGDPHNHMLRHQHAAHLLKNGVPMEKVQKEMRHKSIKVTIDTYGHLLNSDVDPIVQATDPRTRRALDYQRQAALVLDTLKRLHLGGEQVKVEYSVKDNEIMFRMKGTSS